MVFSHASEKADRIQSEDWVKQHLKTYKYRVPPKLLADRRLTWFPSGLREAPTDMQRHRPT